MKKAPANLLGLFLIVSLAVHAGAYELLEKVKIPGPTKVARLTAIPLVTDARDMEPTRLEPKKALTKAPEDKPGTQRFRPNEAVKEDVPEPSPATEQVKKPKEKEAPPAKGVCKEEKKEASPVPHMTAAEHQTYRERLLADFDPDWPEIPELVVLAGPNEQRAVSRFFGMTLIAYPKDEERPSYVIVIDEETGQCRYRRDFDFAAFSNRVKDRGNVAAYRSLVERARRRLALPEDLAIVSLVPAGADAYFAAKQMEAVNSTGVNMNDVVRSEGHYARDADGRYILIIDHLVIKDGRTVPVADPERGAAVEM